jgi:hypothetical protein
MRTNNRAEMYYTYAYLREDGTPYYVGKGKGDRAYRKVGKPCATPKDKSKIIYLKTNLTEEQSFNHERYMIFILGRKDLGTGILLNKSDGGEGASGCIPSEETRRKRSAKMKGENNPLYGKRGKDSPRYGKKHTQETKDKIRKSLQGNVISEETRIKISEKNKLNRLGEKNPFYGRKHSEETKQKMKEAAKRRKEKND